MKEHFIRITGKITGMNMHGLKMQKTWLKGFLSSNGKENIQRQYYTTMIQAKHFNGGGMMNYWRIV